MKYFFATLLLLAWLAASVALVMTIIGVVVVTNAEWQGVAKTTLRVFES